MLRLNVRLYFLSQRKLNIRSRPEADLSLAYAGRLLRALRTLDSPSHFPGSGPRRRWRCCALAGVEKRGLVGNGPLAFQADHRRSRSISAICRVSPPDSDVGQHPVLRFAVTPSLSAFELSPLIVAVSARAEDLLHLHGQQVDCRLPWVARLQHEVAAFRQFRQAFILRTGLRPSGKASSSGVLVTARPACTGASRACVVGEVETMR